VNPSAFAKTHAAAFPAGKAWRPEDFQTYFDRPNTLVAGDENSFIIGTFVIDEAEILTVATKPAHQKQGKARAAMSAFIENAQNKGVARIFLEVAAVPAGECFAVRCHLDGTPPAAALTTKTKQKQR